MTDIVCILDAIPADQRPRHEFVWKALEKARQHITELPNGYALSLLPDNETLMYAAEFITRERLCCPFFTFTIEATSDSLALSLTGTEGVKEFLAQELNLA